MTDVHDAPPIEPLIDSVLERLSRKDEGNPFDVYVWSDGTITNSQSDTEGDVKIVGLFTPTDSLPSRDEVRTTLERGFTVLADEDDGSDPQGPTRAG